MSIFRTKVRHVKSCIFRTKVWHVVCLCRSIFRTKVRHYFCGCEIASSELRFGIISVVASFELRFGIILMFLELLELRTFQIQHKVLEKASLKVKEVFCLLIKIREGDKSIFDVLKWYNDITSFLLDYISVSIKDSGVSNFYRYIIAFKNMLRSVEFRFYIFSLTKTVNLESICQFVCTFCIRITYPFGYANSRLSIEHS
jgi:hypothetical protein